MNTRVLIISILLVILGVTAWFMGSYTDDSPKRLMAQPVSEKDVLDDLKNVVVEKPNVGDEIKMEKHRHGLSLIHISEPTRLLSISYAVFCLKKKKNKHPIQIRILKLHNIKIAI
eukprot:TRINITY_DN47655_c0_g1_i1.p1 TRINITY_DN47655_c0_g1~~TRINITY_DN47655_c0_g1_i1.p1  ORF type:complete len:115 (-),score=8.65 TRINITY_DN47655_c0_g1_i1:44-388(-)